MHIPKIILASGSPRRKELLEQIGLSFDVIPAIGEEHTTKLLPHEVVAELSLQKAQEIAEQFSCKNRIILGADTVVALDSTIMGKPKDEKDAFHMLRALSGNTHKVYTGVTIIYTKKEPQIITFVDATEVTMYKMLDDEILTYIDTKEPMDKAGAYGIQGKCAAYIKGIQGDYNTVVGLPVSRVYHALTDLLDKQRNLHD